MSKVTFDMAMSVDGFVAGPNQSLDNPLVRESKDDCTSGCSTSPARTRLRSRR
jgi:hypothetical protein